MTRGTCATCTFYHTVHHECRLNPPTLVVIQEETHANLLGNLPAKYESKWPNVDDDDWCSGWKSAIVGGRRKSYNHQLNDGDVEAPNE